MVILMVDGGGFSINTEVQYRRYNKLGDVLIYFFGQYDDV